MYDSRKTKQELLAELHALRRRVSRLEAAQKKFALQKKTRSALLKDRGPRRRLKADIEFIGDFDIIYANTVNISQGGICLKTTANLPFEMRYQDNGKTVCKRAQLVWLKHLKKGGYNLGLKFVSGECVNEF